MDLTDAPKTPARAIAVFYVLALGISWGVWAPWVVSARMYPAGASWRYLHLVGSLGPCVAALLLSAWIGGRARLLTFTRSFATIHGVRLALVWGILLPAAAFVASAVIMGIVSHAPVRWTRVAVVTEYPALSPLGYIIASLLFYGFGEEVGWRGFVYPALRQRFAPLTAALLVVPFWAFWHAPLFFATENYRAMGVGGAVGWLLSLAGGSVLTAWLYERGRGSILPAAVLHAALDVFFLADVGVPVQSVMGAVVTVWGVAVAVDLFRRRGLRPSGAAVVVLVWIAAQVTMPG